MSTFNVSTFKQQAKDFLRPFSYLVVVDPPVNGADSRAISLRTQSISVPGVSFAEVDNFKIYGSGLQISIPHTTTIQEISCTHTVDPNGEILQTFYNWANKIVDLKNDNKYSPYYYNDYIRDMSIQVYGLDNKLVKTYELKKAYPKSYDPIELSWDSTELMLLNVTYKFEHFELK